MMLGTMLEESGVRQDTVIFIGIVRRLDDSIRSSMVEKSKHPDL